VAAIVLTFGSGRHAVIGALTLALLASSVAHAAELGPPLASGAATAPAGGATASPAASPEDPPLVKGANAEETYDLNFVGIQHTEFGGYTKGGPQAMYVPKTELWNGFRGKYKVELDALEFYDAVDRPDLHGKAVRHLIAEAGFAFGGLGLIIGGGVYEYRHRDDPDGLPKAGWVVMGAGLICLFVAKGIGPYPITEHEAIILARIHNDRLRTRLGLPPLEEDPTQRTAPPAGPSPPAPSATNRPRRWLVLPTATANAGGLALAGVF
jgi:hypothetical protein